MMVTGARVTVEVGKQATSREMNQNSKHKGARERNGPQAVWIHIHFRQ